MKSTGNKMTNTIIIDTNSWMAIGQHQTPVFEEIGRLFGETQKIATLQGTVTELEKIQETGRGKNKLAAKLALQIISQKVAKKELTLLPINGYVDNMLIKQSEEGNVVLTADRNLQRRLTRPFLIIKQKRYLQLME